MDEGILKLRALGVLESPGRQLLRVLDEQAIFGSTRGLRRASARRKAKTDNQRRCGGPFQGAAHTLPAVAIKEGESSGYILSAESVKDVWMVQFVHDRPMSPKSASMLNAQYNVASPASLPDRIAGYMRRQMYRRFLEAMSPAASDTLIDVGATSDQTLEHSNYAVAWYPHKDHITAVGIDDAAFLEQAYPGVTFRRANGLNLPFADGEFDFAHSSAVLEHVGSRANQTRFISELFRVARKGIFVTTPNRWFPVEFHSVLPLAHWLPRAAFWAILRATGRGALADEEVLNLLERGDLEDIARAAGLATFRIETVGLMGWPTNLLLVATKPDAAS